MRGRFLLALTLLLSTLAWTIAAAEKPTADYQATMKSNATVNMALGAQITAKDYAAIAQSAATLKANFAKLETFWTERKAEDAIGFAKAGAKGAADLEAAAKASNDAAIGAARMAIGGTCGACHMAHRERMPDMTFEIK